MRQRHPWIFTGSIARVEGKPGDGDPVGVTSSDGSWLAWGTWSSRSQIRVRLWSWVEDQPITDELLQERIRRAVAGRAALAADEQTTAYRLVFSESDGLPGLIVDRYGDYVVVQLLHTGVASRAEAIIQGLADALQPQGIYERADPDVQAKEGLARSDGVRWGDAPPEVIEIQEHGKRFGVDLVHGQKTGAYLDQRLNRQRVAAYCEGAEVLSCFSYTGGFELYAAAGGAKHITAIDSSAEALAQARDNVLRNGLPMAMEYIQGNVFSELRRFRAEERRWDVIVLDPPKFAGTVGQVESATRGYKDINLLAMQLLRPGGVLATFSCSGLISADLFQKVVWGAGVDARRDGQIVERLTQSPDHPVLLTFPESEYLKGLILRVW